MVRACLGEPVLCMAVVMHCFSMLMSYARCTGQYILHTASCIVALHVCGMAERSELPLVSTSWWFSLGLAGQCSLTVSACAQKARATVII